MEFLDKNNRPIRLGHVVEWKRRARTYRRRGYQSLDQKVPAATLRGRVIKIQQKIANSWQQIGGKYVKLPKIITSITVKVITTNPYNFGSIVVFPTSKNLTIDTTYPLEIVL